MSTHKFGVALLVVAVVLGLAVAIRLADPGPNPTSRVVEADGKVPPDADLARVVSHIDGDTLRLVGESGSTALSAEEHTTVRLLEIDTPSTEETVPRQSATPSRPRGPSRHASSRSRGMGET